MNSKNKTVEKAVNARQGRAGVPVLAVLVAALVLALVAWGGAEWWGEATDPPGEKTGTAQSSTASSTPTAAPTAGSGNTAPTDKTPHSQSGTGGPVPTTNPSGSTTEKP